MPHSSPSFSTACAAAIVHRNHFLYLYQKDKSSDSKVRFRQASNHCKRVLEAAVIVLNKGESAIPPIFNSPEVLSSASDKAKLFAKNFSKNSNRDDSGISLPVFRSRTNLKLHNIYLTPKMVKKVFNESRFVKGIW